MADVAAARSGARTDATAHAPSHARRDAGRGTPAAGGSDRPDAPSGLSPSRATIDDVAREAGVSTATVSRALRHHPYVAESTRQRVLSAVERLRYVANANAARLASGQSRTVGLVAPMITSWYTSELTVGVEEVLTQARFDLLIGTANSAARERIFSGDARFQQRVDGVILVDVFCGDDAATRLADLDTPIVVLGEQVRDLTSVSIDNTRGARLAARHLIELGHKRIALVGGHTNLDVAKNVPTDRTAGFRDTLRSAGIRMPDAYLHDGDFTIPGGREAMHRLLELAKPPTAVFFLSDEMAFGALHALRERELQVGRDVSVVGFDDHPVSEAIGLTTVRQPVRDIGRLGARLMLDALDGFGVVRHHPVEVDLVARMSTGRPR
ncbi:MAG: LacI family DNA-binding transcriptional regulator [Acidimicrobiales bacterium]|nr:LacI family DNA-binding transcriptional regulator [Acidimicrobiales bacterium]MCB9395135.1 LacI family DNA-binding transcriptional regulator [Acidimicrobiaceae bacterium]